MKIHKIINTLFFIFVFGCMSVQADSLTQFFDNSVDTINYGLIDNIYTNESRIIIGDSSFHYDETTLFYTIYGRKIINLKNTIKHGTPVKYHFSRSPAKRILKEISIVSQKEFNRWSQRAKEEY